MRGSDRSNLAAAAGICRRRLESQKRWRWCWMCFALSWRESFIVEVRADEESLEVCGTEVGCEAWEMKVLKEH